MHEARDNIAVAAAHLHLGAAIEHQEAFAVGVRLHLPDQIEVDDGRAVDLPEDLRVDLVDEFLDRREFWNPDFCTQI